MTFIIITVSISLANYYYVGWNLWCQKVCFSQVQNETKKAEKLWRALRDAESLHFHTQHGASPALPPGFENALPNQSDYKTVLFCSCTWSAKSDLRKENTSVLQLARALHQWGLRWLNLHPNGKHAKKHTHKTPLVHTSMICRLTCLMKSWAKLSGSSTHFSSSPKK